jgi:methionyl aminopeptidase
MNLKSAEALELMKEPSRLVSQTLGQIAKEIKVGITPLALDKIAETFILDHKAIPSFKGYNGFPNTLCISINDVVVHGIPNNKPIESTDIVSIDCGVFFNGFHGDCAYTFIMHDADDAVTQLCKTTEESLYLGIKEAKAGNRVGDIGYAIQTHCESNGYSVVRELVGHGVGNQLHEPPEVPNYGKANSGVMLKAGMTIAIEPMINLGVYQITTDSDQWTIRTKDRKPSAHYEHTIYVGIDTQEILTSHKYIKNEIKENKDIKNI